MAQGTVVSCDNMYFTAIICPKCGQQFLVNAQAYNAAIYLLQHSVDNAHFHCPHDGHKFRLLTAAEKEKLVQTVAKERQDALLFQNATRDPSILDALAER
jgi:hypothetical protein